MRARESDSQRGITMKQLHFVFAAAVGIAAVAAPVASDAATQSGAYGASTADLSSGPAQPKKVTYEKYETKTQSQTYNVKDTKQQQLYYTAPTRSASNAYYSATPATAATVTAACVEANGCIAPVSQRAEAVKQVAGRKYYLMHPFFQPQKGKFGSLTDFAYSANSYDFRLKGCGGTGCIVLNPDSGNPNAGTAFDQGGWNSSQFAISENISYGITDTVAIIAMGRFAMNNYQIKWGGSSNLPSYLADYNSINGTAFVSGSESAKMSDNSFDQLGIGLQWRFVESQEWIGYVGANYVWQDIANTFGADGKLGYKVTSDTTVYGLLRAFFTNWDDSSYGNGIRKNGQNNFIALETDAKSTFNFEGGIGLFSVLDPDWTANLEAMIGDYSWHSQAWLKAAIGWQPTNNFALNLYGKISVWDNADKANNIAIYVWNDADLLNPSFDWNDHCVGANLSNYQEYSIGVQMALYF
ncbi:hypothetical protein FACS189421_09350 [Bacteroidia bacterium]|nr:hypothetical protein FACS189421_09350 [Bacteroidia bacterium]